MPNTGLVQCTDCNVWSDIPVGFNESKHFAQCPKCKKPMYLLRSFSAKELGLNDNIKVIAGLMSQKGY